MDGGDARCRRGARRVSLTEVRPSTSRVDVEVRWRPAPASSIPAEPISRARCRPRLAEYRPDETSLPQGTSVTTFDTQVLLDGQAGRWPFDRFVVDPLVGTAYTDRIGRADHPTRVLVDGEAEDWTVGDDVALGGRPGRPGGTRGGAPVQAASSSTRRCCWR
ncbi:DUF4436 domain-containing protein [Rhodococcus hoagii]|nr:DUF4436 domain-containing protein [Prescottella equi]